MTVDRSAAVRAMHMAPRCGARTRAGESCRAPVCRDKNRCHKHGGAKGSGARPGNTNALKHGAYTKGAKAREKWYRHVFADVRSGVRAALDSVADLQEGDAPPAKSPAKLKT